MTYPTYFYSGIATWLLPLMSTAVHTAPPSVAVGVAKEEPAEGERPSPVKPCVA